MTKLSTKRKSLILLTLLLLILGTWLSQKLRFEEQEIDLGPSALARTDPFLAAQRFLAQQGLEAKTLRSFIFLDDLQWQGQTLGPNDTVILIDSYKAIETSRLRNLLAWVERGGKIIATTTNPFIGEGSGTQDPLLAQLGVELVPEDAEAEDPEPVEIESIEDDQISAEPTSTDETGENLKRVDPLQSDERREACHPKIPAADVYLRQESLLADFSQGRRFYLSKESTTDGEQEESTLAGFDWGLGQIFINADNTLWTNHRIHCHDHAYLLWRLVNPEGKVWFLINQEAPSLWTVLWQASPIGVLTGVAALLLWLWASAVRFGPLLTRSETARRSLADHLHASAILLWRRRNHPYLITQLRENLLQQIQLHCPAFTDWSPSDQVAYLHQLTHINPTVLDHALFSQQITSPQDFTATLASLQTLRKKL